MDAMHVLTSEYIWLLAPPLNVPNGRFYFLLNLFMFTAPPPPSVPDDPPADEESFELPTLEEVARLTGTLRPQSLGNLWLSFSFVSL